MKTITYANRTVVSFSAPQHLYNEVIMIVKKHNAQDVLFNNNIGSGALSHDRSHFIKNAPTFGGAVTFHSHSCNHTKAAEELVKFLNKKGLFLNEELKEIVVTHRENGTPYKQPQHLIVSK